MSEPQQLTLDSDDGSLAFLDIKPDPSSRQFNCKEVTQQQLINVKFYIIAFIKDVKTKFGDNRYLVKIKYDLKDDESKAQKFFTNSPDIKHVLDEIEKRNAFPRSATMKALGTKYFLV